MESRSDDAGRESVVLARGVDEGEGEDGDEPEAEVEACADSGWYDACV